VEVGLGVGGWGGKASGWAVKRFITILATTTTTSGHIWQMCGNVYVLKVRILIEKIFLCHCWSTTTTTAATTTTATTTVVLFCCVDLHFYALFDLFI